MKFQKHIYILGLLVLAFSTIFISACMEQKTLEEDPALEKPKAEVVETPEVPRNAPSYNNLVDGTDFSLASIEGEIAIIDFWATWCGPCRMEIPDFIELYDEYKDKGVTIVGISVDRDSSVVENFIKQQKINYPVIMRTKDLQEKYETAINQPIRAIPTTIIVNQAGEVAAVHIGAKPKEVFEQEIQKLLAEG